MDSETKSPPEEPLLELEVRLLRLFQSLEEINSKFPETRQFLRDRGMEHMAELDGRGRRELLEHLQQIARRMIH